VNILIGKIAEDMKNGRNWRNLGIFQCYAVPELEISGRSSRWMEETNFLRPKVAKCKILDPYFLCL
jgi:hypothetical protein